MSPPIEVKQAVRSHQQSGTSRVDTATSAQTHGGPSAPSTSNLLGRLSFKKSAPAPRTPLPVTVVPAPPRNATSWNEVRGHPPSLRPSSLPPSRNYLHDGPCSDSPLNLSARHSTPDGNSTGLLAPLPAISVQRSLRNSSSRLSQLSQVAVSETFLRQEPRDKSPVSRDSTDTSPISGVDEERAEPLGSSGSPLDHIIAPQGPDSSNKSA